MYQFFISSILMPSPDYTIPKLTGYTYEEVLQDPELRQEFNIVVGQTVESEEAAGTILRQDPAAGSTVKSNNAEITVTVSGGPEVIQMIDVTNQEYLKALATLRDMGLSVEAPNISSMMRCPPTISSPIPLRRGPNSRRGTASIWWLVRGLRRPRSR